MLLAQKILRKLKLNIFNDKLMTTVESVTLRQSFLLQKAFSVALH